MQSSVLHVSVSHGSRRYIRVMFELSLIFTYRTNSCRAPATLTLGMVCYTRAAENFVMKKLGTDIHD